MHKLQEVGSHVHTIKMTQLMDMHTLSIYFHNLYSDIKSRENRGDKKPWKYVSTNTSLPHLPSHHRQVGHSCRYWWVSLLYHLDPNRASPSAHPSWSSYLSRCQKISPIQFGMSLINKNDGKLSTLHPPPPPTNGPAVRWLCFREPAVIFN